MKTVMLLGETQLRRLEKTTRRKFEIVDIFRRPRPCSAGRGRRDFFRVGAKVVWMQLAS